MKISSETLAILQNYGNIQSNMVFHPGKPLRTMTKARNILAKTTVQEEWPVTFGLYDVSDFLNHLNLIEDPEVDITPEKINIYNEDMRIEYYCTDPSELVAPPVDKEITLPSNDVSFTLERSVLSRLQSAAKVLKHDNLKVTPSDKEGMVMLSVVTSRQGNNSANTFSINVPGSFNNEEMVNENFSWEFNHLKLVPGDYEVEISAPNTSVKISQFSNVETDLTYFVTLNKAK